MLCAITQFGVRQAEEKVGAWVGGRKRQVNAAAPGAIGVYFNQER